MSYSDDMDKPKGKRTGRRTFDGGPSLTPSVFLPSVVYEGERVSNVRTKRKTGF